MRCNFRDAPAGKKPKTTGPLVGPSSTKQVWRNNCLIGFPSGTETRSNHRMQQLIFVQQPWPIGLTSSLWHQPTLPGGHIRFKQENGQRSCNTYVASIRHGEWCADDAADYVFGAVITRMRQPCVRSTTTADPLDKQTGPPTASTEIRWP